MALINLRNAMMAGKRLPYDAEVEYLESTGTQYVNTGIAGTNDLALEGDIYLSLSSGFSSNLPFGVKAGPGQDDAQRCLATTYNSVKWIYLQRGAYGYDGRAKVAVSQDGWHYMYLSKSKAVIDNTSATATLPWNVSPENSEPVYIFGFNNNGETNYAQARCRYFRIYSNGTLVRDFIPVRRGTVGYLYDRVTRKLFGNEGTGAFSYGSDVVQVEYIQSDGNAYLDTGVVPAPNLDYSVTFSAQNASTYYRIFGAWASSNQKRYGAIINAQNILYQQMTPHGEVFSAYTSPNIMTAEKRGLDCYVNGSKAGSFTSDIEANEVPYSIHVLGINTSGSAIAASAGERVYAFSLTSNSVAVRSMLSVRVGTEGAMMDVLTRRIYRNAGTGAFTYGNDLKYPIPA